MPKPNYAFEKRQRELAKRKKKEEKLEEKAQRKAAQARGEEGPGAEPGAPDSDTEPLAPAAGGPGPAA